MNRNRLVALAVVTLLAVAAALWLARPADDGSGNRPVLVPGLQNAVNDVAALDVIAPAGEVAVRLRREQARWRVVERDGYEADFAQVVDLLRTLREARRAEPKTSNPGWYARLGVAEPGAGQGAGTGLAFPGMEFETLIVGDTDPTGSGSYVRLRGAERAWLADRVIELPADPVAWLEPGIMDIPAEDIAELVIEHPDGTTVRLQRAGEGEALSFVLRDVPGGREAGPAWKRMGTAAALEGLNLDDVRAAEESEADGAIRARWITTDGLEFAARIRQAGDGAWVRFRVRAVGGDDGDMGDPASARASGASDATGDGEAMTVAERAAAVDERLSPWEFRVVERKAEAMTRSVEDFLEPPAEDQSVSD
ncbi:MAG: DUF4340 domain-containing protein [Wenzhouxiangellaceae bacterium]|nr:DUF4340 domain-containing protein [Wenzhouxiangellaceae bacterium]